MTEKAQKHPPALYALSLTELCERYAFWGIGSLLVLYLNEHFRLSEAKSSHIYGLFTGFSTFLPLIGGFIADRMKNYRYPVFIGMVFNIIGCLFLAVGSIKLTYIGLAVLAAGYGIFTPSLLTLLGHAYHDRLAAREAGFSIYYASINIGVFLALLSLSTVQQVFGWASVFILAAIIQLLGAIPFIWYLKNYHAETKCTIMKELKGHSKQATGKILSHRIYLIFILSIFSILFWMPYNQAFSSMSFFAKNFTLRNFDGFTIPPGWILASESLFLIILAPILAKLYGYLQKKKRDPNPTTKTGLSLISISICFLVMMSVSYVIPPGAKTASINPFFPILAFFFMAIGEMLLAPIGLSLVAHLSPPRYTAMLVGFWYVCVGIAFYFGGLLAGLMPQIHEMHDFFTIFVIEASIPGILMLIFSRKLNRMRHMRDSEELSVSPR